MGKFKMPTVPKFLEKKTLTIGPKREPVWVYLEREMIQNLDKRPYNEKVGKWLKFLRDLKHYFRCEARRKERRLLTEVGPPWYFELSSAQREVLSHLKENIHQDLLEDLPTRIQKSLWDLGVTLKIPKDTLMKAMSESVTDPGIFIWKLYTYCYKKPPSELKANYDINAMILMSCLVFIDLEECVESLEKLTKTEKPRPLEKKKKKNKYYEPNIRYGEYLQKMYIPLYSTHSSGKKKKDFEPIGYKFKLRSQDSYERLCVDNTFLVKRLERNKKAKQAERICTYKFWEPPSTLRNTDPKMVAYVNKLKMFKKKAKAKHKTRFENMQYQISGVSYTGGRPSYILTNVGIQPTGYIPINGGITIKNGAAITLLQGYWRFPKEVIDKCESSCDCLATWDADVMEYIKQSKCTCGHLYDFYHEGKAKEKYFHQPTRHGKLWFDQAKIYQMDPREDFIKDTVRDALMSGEPSIEESGSTISPLGMKESVLLAALLADLSDTPLLIPHLPMANLLNNLQEWVRKKVRGNLLPKEHKQLMLQSQRRWLDLKHMDFKAISYKIPFTLKELEHFNWSHRNMVQTLFEVMLNDFVTRNQRKQMMQTRLWWSTMKYDPYPSKPFLDIFFTYMPGRMKDTFIVNPYSSELTPKYGAKTCPL